MIIEFTPPKKPTLIYKMLLLLQDFPQIRNSYDLIYEKWNHIYGINPGRKTIERVARTIQYDLNIFPPSEEIKRLRKISQNRIIATAEKKSFSQKLFSWL